MLFAGGSAKQARDRRFQAILPLRGKILNVEKKDDASLYKNNEISNLILGLGLGLKGEDVDKLRYGKASIAAVLTWSSGLSIACLQSAHIGPVYVSSFAFRPTDNLFLQHLHVPLPWTAEVMLCAMRHVPEDTASAPAA